MDLGRQVELHLGSDGHHGIYRIDLWCFTRGQRDVQGRKPETESEPDGFVTIIRDITCEKQLDETNDNLVTNVSHELRTPLSSIKAYMEMLIDGEAQDAETRAEFYNIIQGEASRLSQLIDNMLNVSWIESGVLKVRREQVSLSAVVQKVIDVAKSQARAKQVDLVEGPRPQSCQVVGDKDLLYQAILSLVNNAINFTAAGGRVNIDIAADEEDRSLEVSVRDTGVGIPAEDLVYLFDKFYRVPHHRNMVKGTGLGLNLVKHIVKTIHGGKLRVGSEVGKGSIFTFSLPMAEDGNAQTTRSGSHGYEQAFDLDRR